LSEDTVADIFGDMGLKSCDEVAAFGFCDSGITGMMNDMMMMDDGEFASIVAMACCETCGNYDDTQCQNLDSFVAMIGEGDMPFSDCTGLASFGLCNDRIASFAAAIMDDGEDDDGEDDDGGMPEGFGEMVCCETCTSGEWQCADHDIIMKKVGELVELPLPVAITSCDQAVNMNADLCTDDAMIASFVPEGMVWKAGLFSEICCASCEAIAPPPAATITVVFPAKMTVAIAEVPAAGSSQMKVLAGGLKAALEKSLEDVGGEVTIISIGGVNVAGRRLADAEVVFKVSVTEECATATCDDVMSAEKAAEFSGNIGTALTAATADTKAFSATLAESMEAAADELVEAGEITEEEATAAASIEVTANSVKVEEAVIEDPVVATDAPTVTPATDAPTDDVPPADDDLESAGSAAKLSVFSAVAAFAVAMVV
jgi:hypothetical protein